MTNVSNVKNLLVDSGGGVYKQGRKPPYTHTHTHTQIRIHGGGPVQMPSEGISATGYS